MEDNVADKDKQSNKDTAASKQTTNKENSSSQSAHPDENNLKIVAAIGYLGILFLVPMLVYPKEKFAMFHANQGLLLLIVAVGLNIAMSILGFITFGLGFIISPLVWIFLLVMLIIGVVNAMNGHMKRLPLIGKYDILKVQE